MLEIFIFPFFCIKVDTVLFADIGFRNHFRGTISEMHRKGWLKICDTRQLFHSHGIIYIG